MLPRRTLTAGSGARLCLALAAASLLAVGSITPAHALALWAAIAWGRRVLGRLPARAWDGLAIAAIALFPIDYILLSGDLIGAALRLLGLAIVHRCSMPAGPAACRQALSLSFIQMLAAAASTTESFFSLFLAAYMLLAIATLLALAAADERLAGPAPPLKIRSVLLLGASTAAGGLLFFFLIPHFGTGYFSPHSAHRARGDSMSGFTDRVELGAIRRIKKSRAVVMRIRTIGPEVEGLEPPRWRGLALDRFDGRSWLASRTDRRWIRPDATGSLRLGDMPPERTSLVEHEFTLEPLAQPVLFTPAEPVRILSRAISSVGLDADGSVHLPAPRPRRLTYRVDSLSGGSPREGRPAGASLITERVRARYLALPRRDPRVERLARTITSGSGSDFEKARRLEDHLRDHYTYSLDVNDTDVADPVEFFLLEKHPGHCEYFATSMAVMLRHLDIPSRIVTGFTSGEWTGLTGSYLVRQSDAHSWVEAWFPRRGWVAFDPTPAAGEVHGEGLLGRLRRRAARIEVAWDTWIVGLDLLDQHAILSAGYDALRAAGRRAARAIAAVSSFAQAIASAGRRGPAWTAAGLVLAGLGIVGIRRLVAGGWLRRPGGMKPTLATRRFMRFETRWAAQGLRRRPGQTPLEFARRIESERSGGANGDALEFIAWYYRARYGA